MDPYRSSMCSPIYKRSYSLYYKVKYDYEDIDLANVDQIGTWSFLTNAEWLTFDLTTAILNGTPSNDNVGEYWVNISINDTIDIDSDLPDAFSKQDVIFLEKIADAIIDCIE